MVDTTPDEAVDAGPKRRSPLFLIGGPLLALVGLAVAYAALAGGRQGDAESAVASILEDGVSAHLCPTADVDDDISLDGFSQEQPLVLTSIRMNRAAVSFVRPIDGSTSDSAANTDAANDDEAEGDEAVQMVEVLEFDLEAGANSWCVDDVESLTRPATS